MSYMRDHDADAFEQAFGQRLAEMRKKSPDDCPTAEVLARYFQDELSRTEREAVEDHIDLCPVCLEAVVQLREAERQPAKESAQPVDWAEIEKALDRDFYSRLESASGPPERRAEIIDRREQRRVSLAEQLRSAWAQLLWRPQGLAYAGVAALLVVASLYTYAYLSRGPYFQLARIEQEHVSPVRAAADAPEDFREGLQLFRDGDYEAAIARLEGYVEAAPSSFPANYYLGLSHLYEAPAGLPAFPYKFDQQHVDQAILYLQKALALAQDNQFYQEDCYWYLGKAYLMKGDLERAREQFRNILTLTRPNLMRKGQAREMILEISGK
jgi:tetratricopeptide (TPR) repeat protein